MCSRRDTLCITHHVVYQQRSDIMSSVVFHSFARLYAFQPPASPLVSPQGEPDPYSPEALHFGEMIELADEVVRHKLGLRLAEMQRVGRPGATKLVAKYARLNRRLRSAYIALGTVVEAVHRFDRTVLRLENKNPEWPRHSQQVTSRAVEGGHRE